jgi:hypothetical protein
MCTTKVPVLVKARVRKKYMLVGKIAKRVGKIAPAFFCDQFTNDHHSIT